MFTFLAVLRAFIAEWKCLAKMCTSRLDINSKGLANTPEYTMNTRHFSHIRYQIYIYVQTADDSNSNVATTDNKNTINTAEHESWAK